MSVPQTVLLAAFAGLTIYLGLPVAACGERLMSDVHLPRRTTAQTSAGLGPEWR